MRRLSLVLLVAALAVATLAPHAADAQACNLTMLVGSSPAIDSTLTQAASTCSGGGSAGCTACQTAMNGLFQNPCFNLYCPPGSSCSNTIRTATAACPNIQQPQIPSFQSRCNFTSFNVEQNQLMSSCAGLSGACTMSCQMAIDRIFNSPCQQLLCAPGSPCQARLDQLKAGTTCHANPAFQGNEHFDASQSGVVGSQGGMLRLEINRTALMQQPGDRQFANLQANFSINIPGNAIPSAYGSVNIGVAQLNSTSLFQLPNSNNVFLGPPIALTPHGTTFDGNVTLQLPFNGSYPVPAGQRLCVVRASQSSGAMTPLTDCGTFDAPNNLVTINITSFSSYSVATVSSTSSAASAAQPLAVLAAAVIALLSVVMSRSY